MKSNILATLIVISIIILFAFIILFIAFSIAFNFKSNSYTGYYSTLNNSSFLKSLTKIIDYSFINNETTSLVECGKSSHVSNLKLKRIIFGSQAVPHRFLLNLKISELRLILKI